MQKPQRIPVDEELFDLLVRRGKHKDVVSEMLSWNMVTQNWFAFLTNLSTARICQLNNPVDPKIDLIFPFRNYDGKYKERSGPGFVLMNEKAINYIKRRPYEHQPKVSK